MTKHTTSLMRVLRRDDYYAVPAANTVQRSVHRILEHFYRSDVVRVNSYETTTRSRLNRNTIDDVQRLRAAHEGVDATNANRNASVGIRRQEDSGDVRLDRLLYRLAGAAVEVRGGYRCSQPRCLGDWIICRSGYRAQCTRRHEAHDYTTERRDVLRGNYHLVKAQGLEMNRGTNRH
jgi:hypothetical protein